MTDDVAVIIAGVLMSEGAVQTLATPVVNERNG